MPYAPNSNAEGGPDGLEPARLLRHERDEGDDVYDGAPCEEQATQHEHLGDSGRRGQRYRNRGGVIHARGRTHSVFPPLVGAV